MTKIIELKMSITEENLKIIRDALCMSLHILYTPQHLEGKISEEFIQLRDKYYSAIVSEVKDINSVLNYGDSETLLSVEDNKLLNSKFFGPYIKQVSSNVCLHAFSTAFSDKLINDSVTTLLQIPESEWNPAITTQEQKEND